MLSTVQRWLRQRRRTRKKLHKLDGADVVIVSFPKIAAMVK
jgi:hypothetical protein